MAGPSAIVQAERRRALLWLEARLADDPRNGYWLEAVAIYERYLREADAAGGGPGSYDDELADAQARLEDVARMCNEFVIAVTAAGNYLPNGETAPGLSKQRVLRAVNLIYRTATGQWGDKEGSPRDYEPGATVRRRAALHQLTAAEVDEHQRAQGD